MILILHIQNFKSKALRIGLMKGIDLRCKYGIYCLIMYLYIMVFGIILEIINGDIASH